MANRGAPTPPTPLPAAAETRFAGTRVELTSAQIERLGGVVQHVSVDANDLEEHGRDWWPLTVGWAMHDSLVPTRPSVVVRPSTTTEVAAVLKLANTEHLPVTAMAGRSGVCGNALALHGGIALDVTGLTGIDEMDDASCTVTVRAGTFGDVFEDDLCADHRMTCGHWPQSMALSTVGGWLACRGAGQYSTRYGKIEDMVRGLEVVLADGRVVRTGWQGPRGATGPDLTQLFVGSEGTLGVITRAQLLVRPIPAAEWRAAYGFATFGAGLDTLRRILRRGATPAVLRLYDERESNRSHGTGAPGTPEAVNVLLVLDEADPALLEATKRVVEDECRAATPLDDALVGAWLGHRNDVSQMESVIAHGIVVDTIEIAAPWSALPEVHASATTAALAVPGTIVCTCHESHAYVDGACLYFTVAGKPDADLAARERWYVRVWDAVSAATLAGGGVLSHHHGVGLNRARLLPGALGAGFDVLTSVKAALDPHGILNPGKLAMPDPFGAVTWPPRPPGGPSPGP